MTLISVRSRAAIVACCLLATLFANFGQCNNNRIARSTTDKADGLNDIAEVVNDESRNLDDELLGSLVKDFGDHMKETMHSELNKLIEEVEENKSPQAPANKARKSSNSASPRGNDGDTVDDDELRHLREANAQATEEIGARIALAGDTKGALPQWSPGVAASSLLSAASSRLQVAGSFVSDKMRSFGGYVKKKVPLKLRRLIRWPSFLNFKIKFNKSYKSMREELYRQMLYVKSNIVNGVQHLRFFFRRDKHLNGATQFSDWTDKEFRDHFDNKLAEIDEDLTPEKLGQMRAQLLEQKKQQEQQYYSRLHAAAGERAHLGKRSRDKRSVTAMPVEDDDDELNDTEGEESDIENEITMDLDDEEDHDGANLAIIEEYANGADLEHLDDVDNILDEALAANNNFKHIDLRETNCIIRSENQDTCGACYSYVVNAAAYYYNCMEAGPDKRVRRYHARFTSDCGKYLTPPEKFPHLNGCRGGKVTEAVNFTRIVGAQEYGDYQIARISHDFESDNCAYPRPEPELASHNWDVVPVKRYQETENVNLKLEQIDLHLRTMGPVFVNMRVWPNFKDYYNGIYDGLVIDEEQPIIHSMLIIGHNQDKRGRNYYIIWNSHGISWGDNGILYIYEESMHFLAVFYLGLNPKAPALPSS